MCTSSLQVVLPDSTTGRWFPRRSWKQQRIYTIKNEKTRRRRVKRHDHETPTRTASFPRTLHGCAWSTGLTDRPKGGTSIFHGLLLARTRLYIHSILSVPTLHGISKHTEHTGHGTHNIYVVHGCCKHQHKHVLQTPRCNSTALPALLFLLRWPSRVRARF